MTRFILVYPSTETVTRPNTLMGGMDFEATGRDGKGIDRKKIKHVETTLPVNSSHFC